MTALARANPVVVLVVAILLAFVLWLILAPWPPGVTAVMGPKRVFLSALLSGITLGALYFLVASGFTLIFGLMRNVNLAHGSLYLLGGYLGFEIADRTGAWLLAFPVVFVLVALLGVVLQHVVFRRMEGEELRQTLVTIGLSVVIADILLWIWGGKSYQILTPDFLAWPIDLPLVTAIRSDGTAVYLRYPRVRIWILIAAIVVGVAMWLVMTRTRIGMLIRAGVDDRDMLAASGLPIQAVFVLVFAFGAGLAGIAGIIGGTFQSLAPGEDTRFLLASLVVVIVGGMGSSPGAALGALIIGLAEQLGVVYAPTYSVVFTFLIMAAVLAFRPQGLLLGGGADGGGRRGAGSCERDAVQRARPHPCRDLGGCGAAPADADIRQQFRPVPGVRLDLHPQHDCPVSDVPRGLWRHGEPDPDDCRGACRLHGRDPWALGHGAGEPRPCVVDHRSGCDRRRDPVRNARRRARGAHRGHLHNHDHARDRGRLLLFHAAELHDLSTGTLASAWWFHRACSGSTGASPSPSTI